MDLPPGEELEVELLPQGEIDKPTSAKLRREVRHRDSLRCVVPGCDARHGLQAHHERARAKGGPTVADNLVLICAPCHRLTHLDVLEVAGTPMTGLKWNRKPMDPSAMIRDAETLISWLSDLEDAFNARLEEMVAQSGSTHVDLASGMDSGGGRRGSTHVDLATGVDSGGCRPGSTNVDLHARRRAESTYMDTRGRVPRGGDVFRRMDDLVEGLASLGQSRSSARAIVEEAFLELHEPSDEDVLRYALQNPATRST